MTERNALPILKTKLYRPPVATDTIVREKLIGKLETAGRLPLVLVSAPAGYGKSTLISDWVQRESHDCAWISLDKGDQDLRTFLTYVVEALSPFGSETVDRFDEILGAPERHPDQVLIRKFVNAVSSMPGEVKLVLDDYHLCASPAIDACIEALLKHAMSGIQVVIVTRKSPDFDISSLVLSNRVCTIYARDLLFDSCEIRAFGENIVTDFDKEGVSEIKEITEGWAAGLRMVFLEMRGTRSDGNHKTGSAVGTRTVENLFTNLMKTVPQSSSPLWHAAGCRPRPRPCARCFVRWFRR